MMRFFVGACAVLGLSELAPARAQFVAGPLHGPGYGFGSRYSYRSGFGFSFGGPHVRVSGFSGGFVSRAVFYPPLVPVAPFGAAGFGPVPPVGPFGFGPAFGNGWGYAAPNVIVTPPPIIIGGNFGNPDPDAAAENVPPPRNDAVVFPRGAKETDFLVISPRKGTTVPEITRVAPPPQPAPMGAFDPFKPVVKVAVEQPEADPKKEAARLVKLARAAFALGDYGRAAEHFERAITADPTDARAYFLHAQARFAAGQFAEAVARIRDGLARDAKWPAAAFDPAEMYDGRADRFAAHLAALKKAVADNPGQATLEFLLGYQLWFGGEKAEAEKLFRAAEKHLTAPGPISLFK